MRTYILINREAIGRCSPRFTAIYSTFAGRLGQTIYRRVSVLLRHRPKFLWRESGMKHEAEFASERISSGEGNRSRDVASSAGVSMASALHVIDPAELREMINALSTTLLNVEAATRWLDRSNPNITEALVALDSIRQSGPSLTKTVQSLVKRRRGQ